MTGGEEERPHILERAISLRVRIQTAAQPASLLQLAFHEEPAHLLEQLAVRSRLDLVAQSGKLTPISEGLEDFVMEGERRYWLHLAIDRMTGAVVDSQLEIVHE